MAASTLPTDHRLATLMKGYGCGPIVSLPDGKPTLPSQIPYLDLLSTKVRKSAPLLPDAIAEFQGRPVMYLLDATTGEPNANERLELQQRLANRGDHAVLAVVRPGDVVLYPLHLDKEELSKNGLGKVINASSPEAPFLFQRLAAGDLDLDGQSEQADPVFAEIKKLLIRASEELVLTHGLDGLDVLSMTGRALFFRFLIDRQIVSEEDLEEICPAARQGAGPHDLKAVFTTPKRAAQTSAWLDETFNGDLLPLVKSLTASSSTSEKRKHYLAAYERAGEQSGGELFHHLEAILRGWDHIEGVTQPLLPIDWDDLDFRHIPIGVLSQVYEDFSHRVDSEDSLERGVHYTPRLLAKLLVEQALDGLKLPHEAKVLDPACGAGVFLVLTLRELVKRRWEHDLMQHGEKAKRPGKNVIQSILHNQIRGFDVSESALRLAALGLYITVIELNEITRPPSEHHAGKALKDLVLFDQRTESEKHESGFVIGSLGEAVDKRFDGVFDIVLGNPPWTRLTGENLRQVDAAGTSIAQRVMESRKLPELAKKYKNPGGIPDIPFLWRAMEWAKPGGIIAFALEARLILAQSPTATTTRNALLQACSVTGILNGSDLEKTDVWGGMDQPWLLFWARNEKPAIGKHTFHLLTPVRENELCRKGEFRLDYQSAYPVPTKKVLEHGWLCKALAIGTTLDVQIMEKLVKAAERQSIGSFWEAGEKLDMKSGKGFDFSSESLPAPDWLLRLPVFDPSLFDSIDELFKGLKTYREAYGNRRLDRPRTRGLYRSPLVLIPEAPGEDRDDPQAFRITNRDVCFSKSYYGYGGGSSAIASISAALLYSIVHSTLFRHFCYMKSPRLGAGRRTIYKQDIDAFPFPILEELSIEDRAVAFALADKLDGHGVSEWKELDAFVCRLFGLTEVEQQVVEDTVNFNGPYRAVREPAALPTLPNEASAFAKTLENALQPFFKVTGQKVKASVVPRVEGDWQQPWRFVTLLLNGEAWTPSEKVISGLMSEATRSAASRIVMPLPKGGLIIGLINKRRFWTHSRARLCALHISREHLQDNFPVPPSR